MKAVSLVSLGFASMLAVAAWAEPARFELDPDHLVIAFKVHHLGYADTLGFFEEAEGGFTFDEATGELSDVRVTVETDSVYTAHEARDDHLRSDDFLDAAEHETMIFTATGARRTAEQEFEIEGELELLGQRRPLTLNARLNKSGDYPLGEDAYVIGVSATGTVRRSDYGMDYAVDNGWVGDEVEILIEFEAVRQ